VEEKHEARYFPATLPLLLSLATHVLEVEIAPKPQPPITRKDVDDGGEVARVWVLAAQYNRTPTITV
jgi:hypothetical protein